MTLGHVLLQYAQWRVMGGNQPCSIPEPSLFGRVLRVSTRLPSIKIMVYLASIPRMLMSRATAASSD